MSDPSLESSGAHRGWSRRLLGGLLARFGRDSQTHGDAMMSEGRPNALPAEFTDKALVAGYDGSIRFWGDAYSQTFEDMLVEKNTAVRAAADAGGDAARCLLHADFLSISGGGDKGAFAAGVLVGWTERGNRPVFEAVTGVSAGALAAPFAFVGSVHDHCLKDIYTAYGSGDLYKGRGIRGFFSDALNDTSRLDTLIRKHVSEDFLDEIAVAHRAGRRLFVMTTNLDAQRQVIWNMSAIAASPCPRRRDLFVKILRASSAIPGIFPPVNIDVIGPDGRHYDELHVDGGVTAELIFVPPESKILEIEDSIFAHRRKRCLYVIENGKLGPEYKAVDRKILPLTLRAISTTVKFQVIDNLLALALIAKEHNQGFLFNAIPQGFEGMPKAPFDRAYANALFEAGKQVGLKGDWYIMPPASPALVHEMTMEENIWR